MTRQYADAAYQRARRAAETPEQRAVRLQREREAQKAKRAAETDAQRAKRQEVDRNRKRREAEGKPKKTRGRKPTVGEGTGVMRQITLPADYWDLILEMADGEGYSLGIKLAVDKVKGKRK